jgi:small-conductance mechanosensitive channel
MVEFRVNRLCSRRGVLFPALLAGWLAAGSPAAAAPAAVSPAEARPDGATTAERTEAPAEFSVANRHIFTMRASVLGATPAGRATAAGHAVEVAERAGGPLQVTTVAVEEGIAVLVDGRMVFRVRHADIHPETGETVESVAAAAARNLARALRERREAHDSRTLLSAVGQSIVATLLLLGTMWLLARIYRWADRRAHEFVRHRSERHLPHWGRQMLTHGGLAGVITLPVRLLIWLVAVLLVYEWAGFVLERFPYTRPWGEALLGNLLSAFADVGTAVLKAVPGLLFVAFIFFLARLVSRVVRVFFAGVQTGRIEIGWLDETTARPTGQLINVIVWVFALVAAYPYIPGSGSEAFKGIGVFVGLMLSLGASGIVNQAVSGLMLMYTRALRAGEYVKIGDSEGTVRAVGFVNTRIETLRNEEITIPNAVIASSVTRNFSRLAGQGGSWLATQVTIGYDTPWRQVHALLVQAADRTPDVAKEPAPRVRQTALGDFYVEYTLLVNVSDPALRVATLDRLHASIQDAFNEHGVQIMSPHYEADPAAAKVVPRAKWFEPPASRAEP